MKRSPVALIGVVLVWLASASEARADLIHWMYNWSRSPGQINADAPGTGYITLTDESLKSAVGDSDIVATNLRTFSTASPSKPDHFTAKAYTLSLYLFDVDSGQSTTLNFTGQLNGTISSMNSNIKNTFTGLTTQEIVLGNNLYVAVIGPYAPPGPTGSSNAGSISAHASISVMTLPEPSALALSCLGLAIVGIGRLRRRRRGSALPIP